MIYRNKSVEDGKQCSLNDTSCYFLLTFLIPCRQTNFLFYRQEIQYYVRKQFRNIENNLVSS